MSKVVSFPAELAQRVQHGAAVVVAAQDDAVALVVRGPSDDGLAMGVLLTPDEAYEVAAHLTARASRIERGES